MRIVHARRPLALVSPFRACALTRATLSRSQPDLVLFLLTKRVREPLDFQKRAMIVSTNDNHLRSRACVGFPGLRFPDRPGQVEVFHTILEESYPERVVMPFLPLGCHEGNILLACIPGEGAQSIRAIHQLT